MRQFLTLRFWMSIAALIGLTLGLWVVLRSDKRIVATAQHAADPQEHKIDFINLVYGIEADANFGMDHGSVRGELRLIIDGTRTMVIKEGTPGQVTCAQLAEIGKCVVAADLLGDAVVWFALIPSEPRASITLPAIKEIRPDNRVLLTNHWDVARASVVTRTCGDDTASLADFVKRFGDHSTTTFSFEKQQITKVTCTPTS